MIAFKLILVLFLSLLLVGCKTNNNYTKIEWIAPEKPITYPVHFEQKDNGLFIDMTSSKNLLKNIEEMDIYSEKLEVLVNEMKKYYGVK